MASTPSEKLKIDFGWMLNRVADLLTPCECLQIAYAEKLPKSMIPENSSSDEFRVTLLHTLEGRGKFGPLQPEGLIKILEKIHKKNAVAEVNQYKSEQLYKTERSRCRPRKEEARKKGKEDKYTDKPETSEMEEVEMLVAEAKSKMIAHMQTKMRELDMCEMKAKHYSKGEIGIEEVRESFAMFFESLDPNMRTSRTSSMSSRSSEGSTNIDNYGEHSTLHPISEQGGTEDDYTELEVPALPVQETERDATLQGRLSKPIPLPRKNRPPATRGEATPTSGTATLTRGALNASDDFTGGTGDSGVGTGESDREAWIKNSPLPVTGPTIPLSKTSRKPPPVPPRSRGYMVLQGIREQRADEGYTLPFRASSVDDFMAKLNARPS